MIETQFSIKKTNSFLTENFQLDGVDTFINDLAKGRNSEVAKFADNSKLPTLVKT